MSSVADSDLSLTSLQDAVSDLKLTPESALELVKKNAVLVLLNVPAQTDISIDYVSYTVGPKFKGFKMVPPGVHFLASSAFNSETKQRGIKSPCTDACNMKPSTSSLGKNSESKDDETGLFYLTAEEVRVFEYSADTESLVRMQDKQQEERIALFGVRRMEFDMGLAPYPFTRFHDWLELTNHITPQTLQADIAQYACTRAKLLPRPKNLTPAQVTALHFDKSTVLMQALQLMGIADSKKDAEQRRHKVLWSEFQQAFVLFLLGENYSALESWKQMLQVLCTADAYSETHEEFYKHVCKMIEIQLHHIPIDFFHDPLSEGNFIHECLVNLFQILTAKNEAVMKLQAYVLNKFAVDISIELDVE